VRQESASWLYNVNAKDIVVTVVDGFIVAVALTYTPLSCSLISLDLPWAGQIRSDVGYLGTWF
jgi:hypothetical protein